MVLPAASAGATFQIAIRNGKFHGTTAPTTPIGSRTIRPSASGPGGATASNTLSIASAYQRTVLIASGRSISRQSVIGLPASRASSVASSLRLASRASAKRSRTCFRSAGARRDQRPSSNARRAARTAASTSAASPAATWARTWPVAGFSVVKVWPEAASRKRPSMNACVRKEGRAGRVGVVRVAMAPSSPIGARDDRPRPWPDRADALLWARALRNRDEIEERVPHRGIGARRVGVEDRDEDPARDRLLRAVGADEGDADQASRDAPAREVDGDERPHVRPAVGGEDGLDLGLG